LREGVEDEAVLAVATNNLVAEQLASEGEPPQRKLCADLLKRFEAVLDKVRRLHHLILASIGRFVFVVEWGWVVAVCEECSSLLLCRTEECNSRKASRGASLSRRRRSFSPTTPFCYC
jgi:hypothetical protein